MSSQEDITERIDRYLDGQLVGSEQAEFEQQLQQNAELRLEVEAQKSVRKMLQARGEDELRAKFKQFHARLQAEDKAVLLKADDEVSSATTTNVRSMWRKTNVLAIAASFTILLVAGSILWFNHNPLLNSSRTEAISGKIFQVPLMQADGMGYAGTGTEMDSVVVQLLSDKRYANHYRFKDTLQIFSQSLDISRIDQWRIEYNDSLNTYTISISGRRYPLDRGFNDINELKPE